ncbi:hypothetical protein GJ496_000098 [Pomphorhynchus laevis]|nr:hypothetical protein GJ496_000098 [Pomphorhynchus laevis]
MDVNTRPRSAKPFDENIKEIQANVGKVIDEIYNLSNDLTKSLSKNSAASVCALQTQQSAIEKMESQIRNNLKAVYEFQSKIEQLSNEFSKVESLSKAVKEIQTIIATLDKEKSNT